MADKSIQINNFITGPSMFGIQNNSGMTNNKTEKSVLELSSYLREINLDLLDNYPTSSILL